MQTMKEKIHRISRWVGIIGLAGEIISGSLSNHILEVMFHIILWGGIITYTLTEEDVKGSLKKLAMLLLIVVFIALFFRFFPK